MTLAIARSTKLNVMLMAYYRMRPRNAEVKEKRLKSIKFENSEARGAGIKDVNAVPLTLLVATAKIIDTVS